MNKIKKWLPFVLAGYLAVQLIMYIGMYADYTDYVSAYKTARDQMLYVYIERGEVEYLQSQVAHLNATVGFRKAAMTDFLWDTLYVMIPIVVLYTFVFILSMLPEHGERPKRKKKQDLAAPYMEEEDGKVLFDDRTGVH